MHLNWAGVFWGAPQRWLSATRVSVCSLDELYTGENHQYYDEKQARKPKVQKQNCGVSSDTCYYKQSQKVRSRHGKEVSVKSNLIFAIHVAKHPTHTQRKKAVWLCETTLHCPLSHSECMPFNSWICQCCKLVAKWNICHLQTLLLVWRRPPLTLP